MADTKKKSKTIPLSGKYTTAEPSTIGTNFQTLTNMRYEDTHPKGIAGNTKVNTTALSTYLKVRNAFHFQKAQPAESHLLVQAYNTGLTASQILDNRSDIPITSSTDLISNGSFTSGTTGWVATDGTIASVAGGQSGNCLELTRTSAAWSRANQNITTVVGKRYKLVIYVKSGTSGDEAFSVWLYNDTVQDVVSGTTSSTWTKYTTSFVAQYTRYTVILWKNTNTAGTMLFDEVSIREGDFDETALWTDSSGAGRGYFAPAPDGQMIYTNSVDTCMWGGNETKVGAFITTETITGVTGTVSNAKNKTDAMRNTKTDADNIAYVGGGIDDYTKLCIHFNGTDGATTHTAATGQTVTFQGDAKLSTTQKKFGTASLLLDGTGDYCTVPDNSNWDFGTGDFTIDFWLRPTTNAVSKSRGLCGQWVDNQNYWFLRYHDYTTPNIVIYYKVVIANTVIADYNTVTLGIIRDAQHHIELVRSGSDVHIFVNGTKQPVVETTAIAAQALSTFASDLYIGAAGVANATEYLCLGGIDEFRISKGVARHTATFTPNTREYLPDNRYLLVGSPRPLQGVKFYVDSYVGGGTLTGTFWNGSSFTSMTITDGTSGMTQTGSVTFTSTVDLAVPRYIDGYFLYWYQFNLDVGAATISQITLDAPFQDIIDLWDGVYRDISACYLRRDGNFNDRTLNVLKRDYVSTDAGTYLNLASLQAFSTPNNCLELGFAEKMTGLFFEIPPEAPNSTADTTMSVDYWNGREYLSVGTIADGTSDNDVAFARSGAVTWYNSSISDETKAIRVEGITVSTGTIVDFSRSQPFYFYRVRFDKAMDTHMHVDYIGGITASKTISHYKFPVFAQGRVLLCGDMSSEKNKVTCSGKWMSQVYNGDDSVDIYIGDEKELTCGTELFTQYGGNLYSLVLLFKDTEFWIVAGQDINQWGNSIFPVSTSIGCPAPQTLRTITLSTEPSGGININRSLAIFQGANGIYMTDGKAPIPIHHDIKEYFNKNSALCIKASMVGDSVGFMDEEKQEYHWLFASGTSATTLNKELGYDIIRNRWFEIDRGTGMDLQHGTSVEDTYGNQYTYGFIDTGYIERLEYGTTFDGNDITCTMQIGDFLPLETIMQETMIDKLKLLAVAKTTTTNNITVTHYGDSNTTGTTLKDCFDPNHTGYRLAYPFNTDNLGGYTFHSFKFEMTTDDETIPFEPLALGIVYHDMREG